MKLWLWQRSGKAAEGDASSTASGRAAGKGMSIGSLEHVVRNRVRMFLRHTWLVAILGTLIVGTSIWSAIYISIAPSEMRIAAGPLDSPNVKLVALLTQKFSAEHDKIRLHLVSTEGPNESAAAMTGGRADLAILPSTIGNTPDLPVVAILQQNVMTLIVPTPPPPPPAPVVAKPAPPPQAEAPAPEKKEKPVKARKGGKKSKAAKNDTGNDEDKADESKDDKTSKGAKTAAAKAAGKTADKGSDKDDGTEEAGGGGEAASDAKDENKLDKITKLAGKRIGIVTGSVATQELLNLVLNHYGVPLGQVQISSIDPRNVAEAVKSQQVDVLFAAGTATGEAINAAVVAATIDGRAPTFIPIDQADGIAKRNPAFDSVEIDAGTFGGNPPTPDESLKSLSFAEYLVARKADNHDAIGALAKLIYSSRLALAAAMPGEIKIEAPSTDKDASITVHPGALAYLTDDQKTFFDKYGDDIFYGLLIFPIFGSAIAGAASYFHSGGRRRRLRLLQGLLDLVRKAHDTPSLETLDQLQAEADHLVIAIIHHAEREEYDHNAQMSFSVALDQVRFAIATRRSFLLEHRATGTGTDVTSGAKSAAA
jgi:TRAP-type uncharacterized transport system substrate-binding protein